MSTGSNAKDKLVQESKVGVPPQFRDPCSVLLCLHHACLSLQPTSSGQEWEWRYDAQEEMGIGINHNLFARLDHSIPLNWEGVQLFQKKTEADVGKRLSFSWWMIHSSMTLVPWR